MLADEIFEAEDFGFNRKSRRDDGTNKYFRSLGDILLNRYKKLIRTFVTSCLPFEAMTIRLLGSVPPTTNDRHTDQKAPWPA